MGNRESEIWTNMKKWHGGVRAWHACAVKAPLWSGWCEERLPVRADSVLLQDVADTELRNQLCPGQQLFLREAGVEHGSLSGVHLARP